MTQNRLTDLAVLSIESEIARTVEFKDIRHDLVNIEAQKRIVLSVTNRRIEVLILLTKTMSIEI